MVILWLYSQIFEIGACLYYGKKPVQYPVWVTLFAFGFQAWLAPTMPFLLTFRRGCYAPCLKMIDTKWNNFQVELFWWKGTSVICVACCWCWITSTVPYPPFFAIQDTSNPHGAISSRAMVRQKESQEMMQTWPSIASWLIPKKNNSNHPFHALWPGVLSTNCVLCHVTSLVGPSGCTTPPETSQSCNAGPLPSTKYVQDWGEFSRKESRELGRWRRRRRELMFVIEWRLNQNEQNDKTNWNVCVFARQISFLPVSFEFEFFKSTQKLDSVSKNLPVNLRLPDRASTLPWSLCLCLWWWYLGSRLLLTWLDITFNEASGKSKNWRQQTRFMSGGLWIVTTTRRMVIDDILSLQMTITFALIR